MAELPPTPDLDRAPLRELADESRPIFHRPERAYHHLVGWEGSEPVPGGKAFLAHSDDGHPARVEVSFVEPAVVRIRMDLGQEVPGGDSPMLVGSPLPAYTPRAIESDEQTVLASKQLRVSLQRSPWQIRIMGADGKSLYQQQLQDRTLFRFVSIPLGFSQGPDGSLRVHDSFALEPGDRFFGLGEQFGPLEKRGQRVICWSRDTLGLNTTSASYASVPFLLCSRGLGLFLHHPELSIFELANPSQLSGAFQVDAPYLDMFLIYGPQPREILRRYTALTGRPPIPPVWSFGIWLSRCMYQNRAEVEEVVSNARRLHFPMDVVNIDPRWLRNRRTHLLDACDFEWDTSAFEQPEDFLSQLRAKGVRVCLWENPYVWFDSHLFEQEASHGMFAADSQGGWARAIENSEAAIVDFTRASAAQRWQDLHRPLIRQGVAAFKSDYGEGVPPDALFSDGRTGRQLHNLYPLLYARAVFETMEQERGEAIVFGRSGYAGSQRYPLLWTGDAQCSFGAMAGALRAGLSLSTSGFAYWSHDIGGFWNPEGGPPSSELYVRWAQLGLLCSHARFHGTTPREPWVFGQRALQIVRRFARLRYRLIPYLHWLAHEAKASGMPLVRPLCLEYPADRRSLDEETEFMLGPWLLVAPMLCPGRAREVYLPPGDWHSFWDHRRYQGGTSVWAEAPLERMPLYVADDSALPLATLRQWVEQRDWSELAVELRISTSVQATFVLPDANKLRLEAGRVNDRVEVVAEADRPVWLSLRLLSPVSEAAGARRSDGDRPAWRRRGSWLVARTRLAQQRRLVAEL